MQIDPVVSQKLKNGLKSESLSVDALAEKTKVPRSTIKHLLGDPSSAVIPPRIYLRGHLVVLAKELKLDEEELRRFFDESNPEPPAINTQDMRRKKREFYLAAGLVVFSVAVVSTALFFVG